MLWYFPDFYPDELLYSTCARYHFHSGNLSLRDTLGELFGSRSAIPSIIMPLNLNFLSSQLINERYTKEYLMNEYTLLPVFLPFMPMYKRKELIKKVEAGNVSSLYNSIGLAAGEICRRDSLYFCPLCMEEEIKLYGEPYFHRLHQVEGVDVCIKHSIQLVAYCTKFNQIGRHEFIRLDWEKMNQSRLTRNTNITQVQLMIAQAVEFLLARTCCDTNLESLREKYYRLLKQKGYITLNNKVRKKSLKRNIIEYFGSETLVKYESELIEGNYYSWLDNLLSTQIRMIHPLRHILFILFAYGDVSDFFKTRVEETHAFGKPPWPCLNPISEHYMQSTIQHCNYSIAKEKNKFVGTFHCERCGFVYSRTGPDYDINDRYRIGRIKEFGSEWEKKLCELLARGNLSAREISRRMHCDPGTILSRIEKYKIGKYNIDAMESIMNILEETNNTSDNNQNKLEDSSIVQDVSKKYYDNNIVEKDVKKNVFKNTQSRINWSIRDKIIYKSLKHERELILKNEFNRRITKTLLGRRCKFQSVIESNLIKLPKCRSYLEKVVETEKKYHVRKVKRICRRCLNNGEKITTWKVVREAGIRKEFEENILYLIQEYINKQDLYE